MKKIIVLSGLLALFSGNAAVKDTPVNLLQTGEFKPVRMHNKVTAAFGWFFLDWARFKYIRQTVSYVSGEDCFEFDCKDGIATFRFKDPLHKMYRQYNDFLFFGSRVGWPPPPAPEYVSQGKIKFNKGEIRLFGKNLKPGKDWQKFYFKSNHPLTGIPFRPVPGAEFNFSSLSTYAVYPMEGKSILLSDGTRLTKFLLPEETDYITRWGISLWRGWLWKLTGVALPIETVKKATPSPGAFVVLRDKLPPGGWQLSMKNAGAVLKVHDEFSVVPALYDYLRKKLNCSFYYHNAQKVPADASVKQLPTAEYLVKPRFGTFTGDNSIHALSGGRYLPIFSTINDVDYYHLPNPHNDHVFNVILPQEIYAEKHPEYYMLDRNGKRYIDQDPYRTNPCFSSREARELMLKNLKDYAVNQSVAKILTFLTGDAASLCLCPDCIKFNGSDSSGTEALFAFTNDFAPILKKHRPDMKIVRLAYHGLYETPKRNLPEYDNIIFCYCAGETRLPCTLHVDCEINQKGLKEIEAWSRLAKTPERLGYMTYSDIRPLQFAKRMEHYAKYGNAYVYMFQWRGYSPAVTFVINRWNLGEKAEDALKEFDYFYYGKGGKYIHEINLLVEKFASAYKHTEEEKALAKEKQVNFGIWSSHNRMNRKMLNQIYALFDKALLAAGNDKVARQRILKEKSFYLIEDLLKWNRATCSGSEELKQFAHRLADFIRIAAEFPQDYRTTLIPGFPGREFILSVAGLDIPNTGKDWAKEKAAQDFLKNPTGTFRTDPVPSPGAWYFPADRMMTNAKLFYYDYLCPPRITVALRRPSMQQDRASVIFDLKQPPMTDSMLLSVEGLDDEKPGRAVIQITVNGNKLFSGLNSFPERGWGRMTFSVPAKFLKQGENNVTVCNISPDLPSRSTRYANQEDGRHDPQWGWICLTEISLYDVASDFTAFANGEKSTWKIIDGNVKREKGKVILTSSSGKMPVIASTPDAETPVFALNPGDKVRIEITVTGKDENTPDLQLKIHEYQAYATDKNGKQKVKRSGFLGGRKLRITPLTSFKTGKRKMIAIWHFTAGKDTGLIVPEISLSGNGELEINGITMKLEQKGNK